MKKDEKRTYLQVVVTEDLQKVYVLPRKTQRDLQAEYAAKRAAAWWEATGQASKERAAQRQNLTFDQWNKLQAKKSFGAYLRRMLLLDKGKI